LFEAPFLDLLYHAHPDQSFAVHQDRRMPRRLWLLLAIGPSFHGA
jgi:hypothetical protein